MLQSMTGFGQQSEEFNQKTVSIEIKSVNSKGAEVRFKLPLFYQSLEVKLRKLIIELLIRGKIDVNIQFTEDETNNPDQRINTSLFRYYYQQMYQVAEEFNAKDPSIAAAVMRLNNVVIASQKEVPTEEQYFLEQLVQACCQQLIAHRSEEGKSIEKDLRANIQAILSNLMAIEPFEQNRIDNIKHRLSAHLEKLNLDQSFDKNRLEQEMIFYIDKFDISEEKSRLTQHCQYFIQVLDDNTVVKGKKLNFITQEIGREINTLGAKANQSDIQHLVVKMKDELEQIKEQLYNAV